MDCVNGEIRIFLSLQGNATVHCKIRRPQRLVRMSLYRWRLTLFSRSSLTILPMWPHARKETNIVLGWVERQAGTSHDLRFLPLEKFTSVMGSVTSKKSPNVYKSPKTFGDFFLVTLVECHRLFILTWLLCQISILNDVIGCTLIMFSLDVHKVGQICFDQDAFPSVVLLQGQRVRSGRRC